MKNIAALIGVSQYRNAAHLPACAADVEQMTAVLVATGKYDDILCLTEHTDAGQIKDSLRAFFAKHRGNPTEEAFIYFSGHGIYHTDALLCCSDFDSARPSTTSLSNSEIDDLLRSVAPQVAVKVIDACQSGSPYIKDATAGFEKAFRDSQLKAFICMASSRLDQSSYATSDASAFTAKWIDSALQKVNGTVLYRDIQAALADAFVSTPDQTPFFVIQGTGLETFSVVTDEMRQLAIKTTAGGEASDTKDAIIELLNAEIARNDANYVPQEVAIKSIETAWETLEKAYIESSVVREFYIKKVLKGDKLGSLPRIRQVAAFAQEQGWSKKYFVEISTEEYEARVRSFSDIFAQVSGEKPVEKFETRTRPISLESTQPLPFEVAKLIFESPQHLSLHNFVAYIGIVHSLTDVMFLSSVVRLSQKGWNKSAPDLSEIQWKYQNYQWSNIVREPKQIISEITVNIEEKILSYLQSLIPKQETQQSAPVDVPPAPETVN